MNKIFCLVFSRKKFDQNAIYFFVTNLNLANWLLYTIKPTLAKRIATMPCWGRLQSEKEKCIFLKLAGNDLIWTAITCEQFKEVTVFVCRFADVTNMAVLKKYRFLAKSFYNAMLRPSARWQVKNILVWNLQETISYGLRSYPVSF